MTVHRSQHDIHQIRLQTREHHLGFRIAHTSVKFNRLRTVLRDHKTCEQYAAERTTLADHRFGGRNNDVRNRFIDNRLIDMRQRSVCTHTACIRTLISVKNRLVILSRYHRLYGFTINKSEYRHLLAFEELLNYDLIAG